MPREDYIIHAAAVHNSGARFLRDTAACMLPCFTVTNSEGAFTAAKLLNCGEMLLSDAVALCEGLIEHSGISKYTAVCEARMRIAGVELDSALTSRQVVAERKKTVKPGTRSDVYNGYVALSERAAQAADACVNFIDKYISVIKEGRLCFAVPISALSALHRLVADYSAACVKLAAGETAVLVKRTDLFEKLRSCLAYAAMCCGADVTDSAGSDSLAAMASSGLIVSTPPVLFDLLLRYDNLPCVVSGIEAQKLS